MRNERHPQDRRQFLKTLGAAAAGGVLAGAMPQTFAQAQQPQADGDSLVPQRKFGRHDIKVSALAIGGYSLATASSEEESFRIVDEAIAHGVTFMDNCWDYHKGRAEEVMGRALKGKRDKVFLMTKVCNHGQGGKKEALQMLDESLRRLQTDHLDLWQWHAVASMEQVEHGFRPDSVVEALEEAKKQGKTRFVGFTGHTDPDVHLAVLAKKFPFDSCQFPVSPIEANSNAFVRRVLPEVIKQEIAPLAMKSLGGNAKSIQDGVLQVSEALSYVWSHPVAALVSGITSLEQLRQNMAVAKAFQAMSADQLAALENRCLKATESDQYQPYRRWMSYRDGDASKYV